MIALQNRLQIIAIKMNVQNQIQDYISSQPGLKRSDLLELLSLLLKLMPACKLWFLDGKDDTGKIVSNPNIGYGSMQMVARPTNQTGQGKTREFYQIGLSANTIGISVYIMGIRDKTYLPQTFGKKIGKASVTGYCIKFKSLKDIDLEILKEAIQFGLEESKER
jgi:hypothetical protein